MSFRTFLKLSKCKALGDFLISFSELTIPTDCLGCINQNSIFRNWFVILDIFRHWLLNYRHPQILTIVIIYFIFLKPMLLSGKNKMVTSGCETKFWGETAYVCYLIYSFNFFGYWTLPTFLIFTKPNRNLFTSSSRLFTDPIIPRLLEDQEIMPLCYVLSYLSPRVYHLSEIRVKVIHNFTYTQLWWDFLSILWHFFTGKG